MFGLRLKITHGLRGLLEYIVIKNSEQIGLAAAGGVHLSFICTRSPPLTNYTLYVCLIGFKFSSFQRAEKSFKGKDIDLTII